MTKISGTPFLWKGVASEIYGVSLLSINNHSIEATAGGETSLVTDTVSRNPAVLFMDSKQTPVLEFTLEFICDDYMDVYQQVEMKNWLFRSKGYQKFQICADGFESYYFNCTLKPDTDYHPSSQGYVGVKCTAICDSPYAWENVKKKIIPHIGSAATQYRLNNTSADMEDLAPIVRFTVGADGKFKIVNKSYDNLTFEWEGLQSGEEIVCDCQTGIITSSSGLKRLSCFNKNFLKLKEGMNILEFSYDATDISLEYRNAIRLGGVFY